MLSQLAILREGATMQKTFRILALMATCMVLLSRGAMALPDGSADARSQGASRLPSGDNVQQPATKVREATSKDVNDDLMTTFTGLLMVVGFAQLYMFYQQLRAMNKTVKDTGRMIDLGARSAVAEQRSRFAEATNSLFDRLSQRFNGVHEQAAIVKEIVIGIEAAQGIASAPELDAIVLRTNAAAVTATRLISQLQVLEAIFVQHSSLVDYKPEPSEWAKRVIGSATIASVASEALDIPRAVQSLCGKQWSKEWKDAVADWTRKIIEFQTKTIDESSKMNTEFINFAKHSSSPLASLKAKEQAG